MVRMLRHAIVSRQTAMVSACFEEVMPFLWTIRRGLDQGKGTNIVVARQVDRQSCKCPVVAHRVGQEYFMGRRHNPLNSHTELLLSAGDFDDSAPNHRWWQGCVPEKAASAVLL